LSPKVSGKSEKNIGIIGLGLMGLEIAKNLMTSGICVYGFDIDSKRVELFKKDGGKIVNKPSELLEKTRFIILSLPTSLVVKKVLEEDLKLTAETCRRDLIIIDTTTADPLITIEIAKKLEKTNVSFLDVTISGTPSMCARKEVILMAGGKKDILERCIPLLIKFSRKVFHLGPNGAGATMKLIVNLVLGLNRLVLAEGLSLARKAGLQVDTVLEVLKESAAYSKAMDMKGEKMVKGEFTPPQGKLAMHLKDVKLILELGERAGIPLFLSSFHAQVLRALIEKGRGEWDNSAIISFYNDLIDKTN